MGESERNVCVGSVVDCVHCSGDCDNRRGGVDGDAFEQKGEIGGRCEGKEEEFTGLRVRCLFVNYRTQVWELGGDMFREERFTWVCFHFMFVGVNSTVK